MVFVVRAPWVAWAAILFFVPSYGALDDGGNGVSGGGADKSGFDGIGRYDAMG